MGADPIVLLFMWGWMCGALSMLFVVLVMVGLGLGWLASATEAPTRR